MLPEQLKPKFQYELVRVGSNNDGGYLVEKNSLSNSIFLIGGGINDNWEFEKQFNKPFIGIDDRISISYLIKRLAVNTLKIFLFKSPIFLIKSLKNIFEYLKLRKYFLKGYISNYNDPSKGYITIKTIIDKFISKDSSNNIFLKLDIEGSEYRILDDIIEFQNYFSGIIIEFHDIDLHLDKILRFIEVLNLELVHIHPNNFGGVDKNGDPIVIELTFSKKPKIVSKKVSLPNVFDRPNSDKIKDLKLKFK